MATYIVIELTETSKVDYSQVNQTSAQTMRRNLANTQGLLSYITEPSYVTSEALPIVGDKMNHQECLELMATAEWSEPMPE
tara:strand:+ start:899 stop:1141 length:243 start_codon:yes stop_codon:yes gene_type:complete